MDAGIGGATSRFSDRLLRLLERVEHRWAKTPLEKEAAYRLRYEAYIREGLIEPRLDRLLYDKALEDAPNAWITTTFIDGELASTFRIHVAADENDALPSLGVFSDVIMPRLRTGGVIVDPTRLAAQLEFSRQFREMPYIALRPAWLAAEYFQADFVIATISEEHQAFYRRVFGYAPWCEPRDYPNVKCKIVCMGIDFPAAKERVEARYPVFRSTWAERDALFSRRAPRRTRLPTSLEGRLHIPAQ
jgi:hypothetical protein